ncbi:redoxin domain-containing protein [Solwaraspora sp. WMMD1047]|uniref:peroxiredoxin family protein n=1 Tax=Solwaraspora sp. WMMD1047 TaxID=3016102 RepID=UPI00241597E6|nr:redoxin domain-containing protein [Solwaraspora sp. WMMD1047]MDG4828968.1 redoxin domain-containing protein [Solwaraspora sp. WMMD1047]
MALLSVAVIVLTVLVLIDLVLSAAIIRRLRETEAKITEMNTPPESGIMLGEPMPEFETDGGELTHADLAGGPALVGFFSAGCRHCPTQAERLADRAPEITGTGVRVVSVLTSGDGATEDLAPTLRKAGTVIVEPDSAAMMATFREGATPTFLMFGGDGRLLARGHDLGAVLDGK